MGNKGAPKWVQSARQDVRSASRLLNASRNAEFSTVSSAMDAAYGNAASTAAGYSAALSGEQGRQLNALKALQANQRAASAGTTRRTTRDVSTRYGSSIRGAAGTALDTVAVAGKAGTKAVAAQAAAGGILARGNEAAMGTLQQGVAQSQAGAQALTADALRYRAQNDATLIASQMHDIDMAVLQNKLDLQNYRAKLALDDKASGANGQLNLLGQTAGSATTAMLQGMNQWIQGYDDKGNPISYSGPVTQDGNQFFGTNDAGEKILLSAPTTQMVAQSYIQNHGITDEREAQFIYSLAGAMADAGAGKNPGAFSAGDVDDVMNTVTARLSALYPAYAKHSDTIEKLMRAQIGAAIPGAAGNPRNGAKPATAMTIDEKYNYVNDYMKGHVSGGIGPIGKSYDYTIDQTLATLVKAGIIKQSEVKTLKDKWEANQGGGGF